MMTPDETSARVRYRYEHDRKKARLLIVYPALHGFPLASAAEAAAGFAEGARLQIPIAELRPRLQQLAHALGAIYTRGRGDPAALCEMVERSIVMSVSMDDVPTAREIFSSSLAAALAFGRQAFPAEEVEPAPTSEVDVPSTPAEVSALARIYEARRAEVQARKAAAAGPKRAPGRPPKSTETIARERAVREEFARRRETLRTESKIALGRSLAALDEAEASALRAVRRGIDVFAEVDVGAAADAAAGITLPVAGE